jgi:hypothetical protein
MREIQMKIKNWSKFQHFKDRKPPWVKLYRDVLDDLEWHELDPLASKVLVMCWLIASEDEGRLPNIKTLAFRLRMTEKQTLDSINKLSHWLEQDDISAISEQYQLDSLETERETEKEKRQNTQRGTRLPTDFLFPKEWADFCHQERPDLNIQKTFDSFKDFWIAKPGAGGVKLNWEATWRNWVRSQKQGFAKQDIVHQTTPTPANHDAALRKIEEDRKKAVPIPESVKLFAKQIKATI